MSGTNGQLYKRDGRRFVQAVPQTPDEARIERFAAQAQLPKRVIAKAFDAMQATYFTVGRILRNSDVAFRADRRLQEMMRHDPDVMSPLQQRQLATAELEWEIVPEDEENEKQVNQAKELTRIIERYLRDKVDMWRSLLEAIFYGPAATNLIYQRVQGGVVAPVDWVPLHSDTLIYDENGALGMLVGPTHPKWMESVVSENGRAIIFDKLERQAIVNHIFMRQGPTYNDPFTARYMYSGRGLRDTLWFTWLVKQTMQKLWTLYAQRFGMGTRKGYYEAGNMDARNNMEDVLQNMAEDAYVLLPRIMENGSPVAVNDVEVQEAANTKSDVFTRIIKEYLAGLLKEQITGMTPEEQAASDGVGGEGASTRRAESFMRLIRYDAETLGNTITRDFIVPLHRMNFGDTEWMPQFKFALEDVDSEKWMGGVEKFFNMGGTVSERQVRSRLGLDEPKEGEPILEKQFDPLGAGGLDAFNRTRAQFGRALK